MIDENEFSEHENRIESTISSVKRINLDTVRTLKYSVKTSAPSIRSVKLQTNHNAINMSVYMHIK